MMHGGVECLAVFDAFSVLRQPQVQVNFSVHDFECFKSSPATFLIRCSDGAGVFQQTFDQVGVSTPERVESIEVPATLMLSTSHRRSACEDRGPSPRHVCIH